MAKEVLLKNKLGETISPITGSRQVLREDGTPIEVSLELAEQELKSTKEKTETNANEIKNKQDKLESGESIKTINGESILGSGNIATDELSFRLQWLAVGGY